MLHSPWHRYTTPSQPSTLVAFSNVVDKHLARSYGKGKGCLVFTVHRSGDSMAAGSALRWQQQEYGLLALSFADWEQKHADSHLDFSVYSVQSNVPPWDVAVQILHQLILSGNVLTCRIH